MRTLKGAMMLTSICTKNASESLHALRTFITILFNETSKIGVLNETPYIAIRCTEGEAFLTIADQMHP